MEELELRQIADGIFDVIYKKRLVGHVKEHNALPGEHGFLGFALEWLSEGAAGYTAADTAVSVAKLWISKNSGQAQKTDQPQKDEVAEWGTGVTDKEREWVNRVAQQYDIFAAVMRHPKTGHRVKITTRGCLVYQTKDGYEVLEFRNGRGNL